MRTLKIIIIFISLSNNSIFAEEINLTLYKYNSSEPLVKSVSIFDGNIVVGTNNDCCRDGFFNAIRWVKSSWVVDEQHQSPGPGSIFWGFAVSMYDNYLIVGDPEFDRISKGTVYCYELSNGIWLYKQSLEIPKDSNSESFGYAVSVFGEYAIIGASGAAYMIKREETNWVHYQELITNNEQKSEHFGHSVFLYEDNAIIGDSESDAAYIFTNYEGNWKQKQKVVATDDKNSISFGCKVSMYGNYAIIGASADNDIAENAGSAYIFKKENNFWLQYQKLKAPDGNDCDRFGSSVYIFDEKAIVGVPYDDDKGTDSGTAYIYILKMDKWELCSKLFPKDDSDNAHFGSNISIYDDNIAIGLNREAYIFSNVNTDNPIELRVISGYIISANNNPISGAKISFSGYGNIFTNSSGFYALEVLKGWRGFATPSGKGYKYFPRAIEFTEITENQTANFIGQRFTISGKITDSNNSPISNVKLTFSNAGQTTTDDNGFFTHDIDYLWSGNLIPEKNGLEFTPSEYSYDTISTNFIDQNFVGKQKMQVISGTITDQDNAPIANISVCIQDNCVQSDISGKYRMDVPFHWSGKVVFSNDAYTFTPSSRSYTEIINNKTGQDVCGVTHRFMISGVILDQTTGKAVQGVRLKMSNGNTVSNAKGQYFFEPVYHWSGTIQPEKTGYTFEPQDFSISSIDSDRTDLNFSAIKKRVHITGQINDQNNDPVKGVIINFVGSGQCESDSNGNYDMAVDYGWTGKTELFKPGFTFVPTTKNYSDMVISDMSDELYYATPSNGNASILVTPDIQNISADKGSVSFEILRFPETVYLSIGSSPDWISIEIRSGQLIVDYEQNPDTNERIGNIVVEASESKNSPKMLTIIQSGARPQVGPNWKNSFDPSIYQYNCTITAIVRDDLHTLLEGNDDQLAAFIHDECRGIATPIETTYGKRFFLQVWHNAPSDADISFKYYDAAKNRIYHHIKYPMPFISNQSTGKIITPHELIVSEFFIRLQLNKHWNWITMNAINADMSVSNVLSSIADKGIIIVGQEGYSQYMPEIKTWGGSLTQISPTAMYMLKTNDTCFLEFSGDALDLSQTMIPLKPNWNWIGYLPATEMSINIALQAIDKNGIKICGQHGYADYLKNNGWFGSLIRLYPNRGYLLKMETNDTLSYPVIDSKARTRNRKRSIQIQSSINGWTVDSSIYRHQMTLTASVYMNDKTMGEAGDVLAAFVNNQCRGLAIPSESPYGTRYYLQVWGSEQESVNLKFYHASEDKIYPTDTQTAFSSNMSIGTISSPKTIMIKPESMADPEQDIQRIKEKLVTTKYILSKTQAELTQTRQILTQKQKALEEKNNEIGQLKIDLSKISGFSITLDTGWHLLGGMPLDITPSTHPANCISVMYMYNEGTYHRIQYIPAHKGVWANITEKCEILIEKQVE